MTEQLKIMREKISDLFKNKVIVNISTPMISVGLFLLIFAIINLVASYAGLKCQNENTNTNTMYNYSGWRGYLIFSMTLTSLVGIIGIGLMISSYFWPLLLISDK